MQIRSLRAWCLRALSVFSNERNEREMKQELESHLQMQVEDNIRAGMSPEVARRQAVLKLGGMESAREEVRSRRGIPLLENAARDLKYGLRMLAKSPSFTAVALISLALGIGANSAIFSVVNTLFLRPLPIEEPARFVRISNRAENQMFPTFSYPNYKDLRDRNRVFSGLLAYRFAPINLSHDGVNEKLWAYLISGNYFRVLGLNPAAGRLITEDDDRLAGAHPVTVLSYDCWQRRFGAREDVLGKTVIVNGKGYKIIGVAPRGFFGTETIAAPEMWFPLMMQKEIEVGDSWLEQRGSDYLFLQGRLRAGVSSAKAETGLNVIAADLAREFPEENEGMRVSVQPTGILAPRGMRGAIVSFAAVLMAVVGIVLLLACINLANLLLARAIDRRKEISVRLALGAGRARIVAQLLAECLLLSLTSGAMGCLLAYWIVRMASAWKPPFDFPLLLDLHLDSRVLIFTTLISIVTGILFGLLPALQATRMDVMPALKDEVIIAGIKRGRAKNALIVAQLAMALLLLAGAGLMVRALQKAQHVQLGFDPQNAVAVSFDLRLQGYDESRGRQFLRELLDRIRSLPGVRFAGSTDLAPVDLHFPKTAVYIEGTLPQRNAKAPRAMTNRGTPGYLPAMGTRLIQGRDFTDNDDERGAKVAIVNQTFAKRFWPGMDPIGKRFSRRAPEEPKMEVVGVMEDGKYAGLNEEPQPYFLTPILQNYSGNTMMIARSEMNSDRTIASIRAELQRMDPNLPITSAKALTGRMALPLLPARLLAGIFGAFGLVALALVAIGIYGVMSYAVSARAREFGVRVAMGAPSRHVFALAIAQGLKLALVGLAIGVPCALALSNGIRRMLYGVSAADPLTFVSVSALLLLAALLSCYFPARRAARINPMIALRNE